MGRNLAKNLAALRQRIGHKVEMGLKAVGDQILETSQGMVPVDSGYLKETGRVQIAGAGFDTMVQVGYGGFFEFPSALRKNSSDGQEVYKWPWEYAVRQHEDQNIAHRNGQHNYLRDAMMQIDTLSMAFREGAAGG